MVLLCCAREENNEKAAAPTPQTQSTPREASPLHNKPTQNTTFSMPYPSSQPVRKHDLLAQRLPPSVEMSALDKYGLGTDEEIFFTAVSKGVLENMKRDMKLLAHVYSYDDGPKEEIRTNMFVIGYISLTHTVVRTLIGEEEQHEVDKSLHRCTIAVIRGDGAYGKQLDEKHRINSLTFAHFVQRLRKEGIVAVVGQDRLGRMAILKPVQVSSDGDFHENDFHISCYVGKTAEIKDALAMHQNQQFEGNIVPHSPPPPPGGFDENGPVWKNPEGDDDNAPSSFQPKREGVYPEDEPVFVPDDASHTSELDQYVPPYTAGSGTQADNWVPTEIRSNDNNIGSAPSELWGQVVNASRKRPRLDQNNVDNDAGNGGHFHANEQARRTEAFYQTVDRSEETGPDSQIYHMRKFNNWVKALQMQEVNPSTKGNEAGELRILDLVCIARAALNLY
jgi:hypothetical protein